MKGSDSPLLELSIPGAGVLMPAIFQGPPIKQLPKPPAMPSENGGSNQGLMTPNPSDDDEIGYGVIIWIDKFRQISMGSLILVTKKQVTDDDSDYLDYIDGGSFGELGTGEIVIQVAWQRLQKHDSEYNSSGSLAAEEPNSNACAILTNQRLMIFLANGYPVLSYPPQNSAGLSPPPISCLWVGPALLYLTEAGEVYQLMWDGSTAMICGAPATGNIILAAAYADRLLFLCRDPDTSSLQIETRHAYIGSVLLMGIATLATSGLMPHAWVHVNAKSQMKTIAENFDMTSISVPVARTLVKSGFANVAKTIADKWPKEAAKIKVNNSFVM